MVYFFDKLQSLENEKWELLGQNNIKKVYSSIGLNKDEVYDFIDTKI